MNRFSVQLAASIGSIGFSLSSIPFASKPLRSSSLGPKLSIVTEWLFSSVMQERRFLLDASAERLQRPRPRRLPASANAKEDALSVRGRRNAYLVPGKPSAKLSAFPFAYFGIAEEYALSRCIRPDRVASLWHPESAVETLEIQYPGVFRVPVIPCRACGGMESENAHQIFWPFRYGDLARVENRSGKRGEGAAAAEAAIPSRSVSVVAVALESAMPAARARLDGKPVRQIGF